MIGLAVACTILGGIVGASLEPVSFSVSIPIAIMGGFIMKEIREPGRQTSLKFKAGGKWD